MVISIFSHIEAYPVEKMTENPQNGQKWSKNGLLTLKMRFSDLGVNRKVVSNGLFYLNMKFKQNR